MFENLKMFEVFNPRSGESLGGYTGVDALAALDACAQDAGYGSYAMACASFGDCLGAREIL